MRKLKPEEFDLITKLCDGKYKIPEQVSDLNDGGMGSISFDLSKTQKRYKEIAKALYTDSDGVLVDIELTIDYNGNLFELDFWKVNFNPILVYPTFEQLNINTSI